MRGNSQVRFLGGDGAVMYCLYPTMCGEFPEYPPDYPVLWGDTYGYKPAPWGERVIIECS